MAKKDFFISYTSADEPWAEWIAWQLSANGFTIIFKKWDFHPGNNILFSIVNATSESEKTIAVLSSRYMNALEENEEISLALFQDSRACKGGLIPIRIEPVKQKGLFTSLIPIDLIGLDESKAEFELLLKISTSIQGSSRKPKAEPKFPGHPIHLKSAPIYPGSKQPDGEFVEPMSSVIASVAGLNTSDFEKELLRFNRVHYSFPNFKISDLINPELLFWRSGDVAIIPGNTNKRLLAESGGKPKMSPYINYALDMAAYLLAESDSERLVEVASYADYRANPTRYKNLLLIGGPVANELTKKLCGYKNEKIKGTKQNKPDEIAVFTHQMPYPAYFDIGNVDDGYDVIMALRPNFGFDDKMLDDLNGTYRIIYKGNTMSPIVINGRLRSDMLMIIRIPNPLYPVDGRITIIGGMHGYSLRAFFDKRYFVYNMNMLCKRAGDDIFYQMLIPSEIEDDGYARLLWDGKKDFGWENWGFQNDLIDPNKLDLFL
jgi:hypothetical protein